MFNLRVQAETADLPRVNEQAFTGTTRNFKPSKWFAIIVVSQACMKHSTN